MFNRHTQGPHISKMECPVCDVIGGRSHKNKNRGKFVVWENGYSSNGMTELMKLKLVCVGCHTKQTYLLTRRIETHGKQQTKNKNK